MKNLWKKFKATKISTKITLIFFLIAGLGGGCSQAGWVGYYYMNEPAFYERAITHCNYSNTACNISNIALIKSHQDIWISLPRDNSFFKLSGFITPFTPPIPIFFLRSWDDTNFTTQSKPTATIKLKLEDKKTHEVKIYDPQVSQALYGYTQYTFPLKSKNIDSGILIIEKDGEVIEVPFEYRYARFWH